MSDRDTLATELLPHRRDLFAVSVEPLLDKYLRISSRWRHGAGDGYQPLARYHDRGLILPVALGDVGDQPQVRTLHVGTANAGCSSLREVDRHSNRLKWCKRSAEAREVPVLSLRTLLSWIHPPHREVEFLKVDAQGMDVDIVRSAGSAISRVRSPSISSSSPRTAT